MRLLLYPEDEMRLRRRAESFPSDAFGTPQIRQLAALLADTLEPIENCEVLAATQLALPFEPAWRMLAIRAPAGISILCNPHIRSHSGDDFNVETCASFACVPERALAPRKVTVEYRKLDGTLREVECEGSGARFVWQGVESLDGKLFLDRLSLLQKKEFLGRVRQRRRVGRA